MNRLSEHLADHDFSGLFIEVLGWDRIKAHLTVDIDGAAIQLATIAEKRGLRVIHCGADRYPLFDRRKLRAIQRRVLKVAHEHILIYTCDEPKKQVWQWAILRSDGRTLFHREHPFFSNAPPTALVARIHELRFTLAEEENITLIDALQRVRLALDTKAEQNLFVDRPWYARMSDELARRMEGGGIEAYHEFVLFHQRLPQWATRKFAYVLGLDDEDAEQIGMICLLRAAKRFEPERGYQFSTYATTSIRRECTRVGPKVAFLIRPPVHRFWRLNRVRRAVVRLQARRGPVRTSEILEWAMLRDSRFAADWSDFVRAMNVRSCSDPSRPEFDQVRQLISTEPDPAFQSRFDRGLEYLDECLADLPPNDADLLRRRYGIDCEPETLEAIGCSLGVTKERIRQRQLKIERDLRNMLLEKLGEERSTCGNGEAASGDKEDTGRQDKPTHSHAHGTLLARIRQWPHGISAVDLAWQSGLPRRVRKGALQYLVKNGLVTVTGAGRTAVYRLAPAPSQTTEPGQITGLFPNGD